MRKLHKSTTTNSRNPQEKQIQDRLVKKRRRLPVRESFVFACLVYHSKEQGRGRSFLLRPTTTSTCDEYIPSFPVPSSLFPLFLLFSHYLSTDLRALSIQISVAQCLTILHSNHIPPSPPHPSSHLPNPENPTTNFTPNWKYVTLDFSLYTLNTQKCDSLEIPKFAP